MSNSMDSLPTELVVAVIFHLPLEDMKATRLTCRRLSVIVFPLLCTHIATMDIRYCLDDFEACLKYAGTLLSRGNSQYTTELGRGVQGKNGSCIHSSSMMPNLECSTGARK